MANFAYVARSKAGEEVSGFLSGGSLEEIVNRLHGQGLAVLHVAEDKSGGRKLSWRQQLSSITFGRVSTRDLALFNRQFSTILEAGIPLVRGLRGLSADSSNKILQKALDDLAVRIERGESMSEAMAAHPEVFNDMYLAMIRAGERAGTLDQIVEQLAVYLEKVDAIKTKVRSALAYPVFILAFAILATLFLLLKIVPTFAEIYADFGQQLPALTLLIVTVSNLIRNNALIAILLTLAVLAGIWLLLRTKAGRYAFDAFLLRMPIFGPVVRKAVMSRFARTFGILMNSGLPILEGLDLVGGAAGNVVIAQAVADAKEKVAAGRGITESFRATRKFPEMVLQLMSTGEESGDLDSMLLKTSDFYDRQVEATVQSLSSLIEPVMIVIVGGLIGVIVVSMFLPIFYLGEAIMKGGYSY